MKKIDLDRMLRDLGWWLAREGGRHEVWTNGEMAEAVPRHREIDEHTARSILRKARSSPGQGAKP
jgi:mRNA interferase HicA